MINLRSGKDVHIPTGVPKRRVEHVSIQEETHIEKEPQQPTFQPIDVNSQATTSAENNELAIMEKDVVVLIAIGHNITKKK